MVLRGAMRAILSLAFVLFAVGLLVTPALAEKRIAVVIGNGAYQSASRLGNPPNDAQDVAVALKRLGFETVLHQNLEKAGMQAAMAAFARAARTADVAMFYFSGHAVQRAGVNYLMPIDAKLDDEADLGQMVRVNDVVADLQQAKNLRILVLDACRDNPLAEQQSRASGPFGSLPFERGLAKIENPLGMIVAYATQAGRTAEDGAGRNSPYTAAFLKHIETQEEIGTIFRRISGEVYEATKRTQLPELSLSLAGEFYLRGRLAAAAPASPASPDPCAAAAEHWKAADARGTLAAYEDHLTRFGQCAYAGFAKARIEDLKKKLAAVAPPVPLKSPSQAPQPAVGVFGLPSVPVPPFVPVDPLSPERELTMRPGESFKECDACPEMVAVPAGSFMMGSPKGEKGRNPSQSPKEEPQQRIVFLQQFAVARFATTLEEWDACVAEGGCSYRAPRYDTAQRPRLPVIAVSWNDAQEYVAWLSRRSGKRYRLLSEAEREYVTRAGTTTPYWWGSSISERQANYDGIASNGKGVVKPGKGPMPVDSFQPNQWGLYQVHGNVAEWVEDCSGDYRNQPPGGAARVDGNCTAHVLRGGGWGLSPEHLRSASRASGDSDVRSIMFGFRVARSLGFD
jgi:formylglycine-generating enzyme required for sulfatase activity